MMADVGELLDNPAWHALTGRQRAFADPLAGPGDGGPVRATRFDPDVAVFGALPDEPAAEDWAAMAAMLGPEGGVALVRTEIDLPDGWTEHWRGTGRQMVGVEAQGEPAPAEAGVARLGPDDLADVLELIALTEPGPFQIRTMELGRYIGIRDDDGRLVAMSGERMAPDGHCEISAVCTHPDHRGRGLAALLVADGVHDIRRRGDVPILHVVHDNTTAIRVYERLGFRARRDMTFALIGPTPS